MIFVNAHVSQASASWIGAERSIPMTMRGNLSRLRYPMWPKRLCQTCIVSGFSLLAAQAYNCSSASCYSTCRNQQLFRTSALKLRPPLVPCFCRPHQPWMCRLYSTTCLSLLTVQCPSRGAFVHCSACCSVVCGRPLHMMGRGLMLVC